MRKASLEPKYDSKKRRWYVSIPASLSDTGKRQRKYFGKKEDAVVEGEDIHKRKAKSEEVVRKAGAKLIETAVNYDELLRDLYGYSGLAEACEDLMKIKDREVKSETLGSLFDGYEADNAGNWTNRYATNWRWFRKKFADLENKPVVQLGPDFWTRWFNERAQKEQWKDRTFNDMKRMLSGVWRRACLVGAVEKNPIEAVRPRKLRAEEKPVYTVEEVEAVMNCAWKHDREMVPFFALAIFAGLRPDENGEISRLRWEDIDFESGEIRVGFDNKTGTKRFVEMEPNLKEWLLPWKGKTGPVMPTNFRRRRRNITRGKYQAAEGTPESEWVELVPYGPEVRDITRHTYGSYFEAMFKDPNRLKLNMGHTDFSTFEQHYRNARPQKEAEKFWNLRPPSEED
jgi:integrase